MGSPPPSPACSALPLPAPIPHSRPSPHAACLALANHHHCRCLLWLQSAYILYLQRNVRHRPHRGSEIYQPLPAHPSLPCQAAWKPKPVSLNIPASTKPVRIILEGTPLLKGMLVLTGCRWDGIWAWLAGRLGPSCCLRACCLRGPLLWLPARTACAVPGTCCAASSRHRNRKLQPPTPHGRQPAG